MKAMILAAGKGSRLYPLTASKPKALVDINGKTLLELLILRLKSFGFQEIIINVHHWADQIIEFLKSKQNFALHIEISKEEQLLDTGGGLKKARWFFDDQKPFLLHNVDVLTDLDFKKMLEYHSYSNALATLAVRKRKTSRYLLGDSEQNFCGWQNLTLQQNKITRSPVGKLQPFSFMGIHILSSPIFEWMEEKNIFSIVDTYLSSAATQSIKLMPCDAYRWLDLGKPENLREALTLFPDYF